MEIINLSNLHDESVSNNSKIISNNINKISNLKGKFSSLQFSSSSSIKNKNFENSNFIKGSSSKNKRLTFILSENETKNISNFEQISQLNKNNNNNKIYFHNKNENYENDKNSNTDNSNDDDIKTIKTKFANQSELKISLAVLRGKRLKKIDLKQNNKVETFRSSKTSQRNSSIGNIKTNFMTSDSGNSGFGKFFKKPLTFRLSEFEDKKRINNNPNEKEKKNIDYTRFFDINFDEATFEKDKKIEINKFPIKIRNNNDDFFQENSSKSFLTNNKSFDFNKDKNTNNNVKNKLQANSNDIEKIKLLNNEEDLVKKYVLPELTTEERERQLKSNLDDNYEKVVIHKGNGVFLCDLLKSSNQIVGKNTSSKSGFSKLISPQNPFDPKNSAVNVNDVKFGMKPKFLIKSCGFVRYGESNKNLEQELKNLEDLARGDSDKRINFHKTFNVFKKDNLSKMNLNNIKNDKRENSFFQKTYHYNHKNKNFPSSLILDNLDKQVEKGDNLKENSKKIISKTSSCEFYLKPNNLKNPEIFENKHNLDNIPKIENYNHKKHSAFNDNVLKFSKTNIVFHNYTKNKYLSNKACTSEDFFQNKNFSSTAYFNEDNYNKEFYGSAYPSEQASVMNPERTSVLDTKKNFRKIYLEYPNLKFSIQPYRKLDIKRKEKSDSYVNGSIINESAVLNNIKSINKKIAKRIKDDRVSNVSNALSENMDRLNIIQNKIGNIIGKACEKMQRKFNKHSINSLNNLSISIK